MLTLSYPYGYNTRKQCSLKRSIKNEKIKKIKREKGFSSLFGKKNKKKRKRIFDEVGESGESRRI